MMNMDIISEIESKNYSKVKFLLAEEHVPDISDLLEQLDDDLILAKVFKLLPKDIAAEVFSYTDADTQERLVRVFSDKELQNIITEMYTDDLVDFVDEMPANIVEKILKNSKLETRQLINKFLQYEDNTAGSVMTSEYLDVKADMTIEDIISKIRKCGNELETISVIYVTDSSRILEGFITIRDLVLAEPNQVAKDIMRTNLIFEHTSTDQEEIAKLFKQYDFPALPIVDRENRLVGIVTVDDVVHIIDDEASEDISKITAITPSEKPYLKTSVFKLWIQRIPWLAILMLSATFTSLIITHNEAVLSGASFGILITACMPMVMGTGGNSGGQASVTIIRGLALNEIGLRDIFRVLWKEVRVSVLVGASLSVLCFLKLLFIDSMIRVDNGVMIAVVVCLAMFFTVVVAKIAGCLLPLLAKACHLDPAVMASPFIQTIVDTVSLSILCALAFAMLPV